MRASRLAVFTLTLTLFWGVGCDGPHAAEPQPTATKPAADEIRFEQVAASRGIDFEHRSGHREHFFIPESVAGGGGFFDADGDGDLDVYLVQSGSLLDAAQRRPGNQLYENRGDGKFRNVTATSGADDDGYGMGVASGDYDNDGDLDLYVTNVGRNTLLRNDGGHKFTDVTTDAKVGHARWGASAGFFDYDRDGDLDLFVVNYIDWTPERAGRCRNRMRQPDYCSPGRFRAPAVDVLYRNDGDGTFTDVSGPSGIAAGRGNGLGLVFGDFDDDGWIDVFVANDATPDRLWINRRDGTFSDQALAAGCAVDPDYGYAKAGMGTTAGDLDHDGDLDLMICNFIGQTDSLFLNQGGTFIDGISRAGLSTVSVPFTRFGVGWADFDNDGLLDLYQASGRIKRRSPHFSDDPYAEPNLVFRGHAGPRFEEVRPRGGTAELLAATSRAAAFGDFDDDGGIDILVVNKDAPPHLLRNVTAQRGHWIRFRVLDRHGKHALGARIEALLGDRSLHGDVRSAYSYLAANDSRVHFGLGSVERVGKVVVRWTDGTSESFGPFETDRTVTLRQSGS